MMDVEKMLMHRQIAKRLASVLKKNTPPSVQRKIIEDLKNTPPATRNFATPSRQWRN